MQAKPTDSAAHVVCGECRTRWRVPYKPGYTTPMQPRECQNRECDAHWLDLSMFLEKADADHAANKANPAARQQAHVLDLLGRSRRGRGRSSRRS